MFPLSRVPFGVPIFPLQNRPKNRSPPEQKQRQPIPLTAYCTKRDEDWATYRRVLCHLSSAERRVAQRIALRVDLVDQAQFQGGGRAGRLAFGSPQRFSSATGNLLHMTPDSRQGAGLHVMPFKVGEPRCPFWVVLLEKMMVIPDLPGGLIIYQDHLFEDTYAQGSQLNVFQKRAKIPVGVLLV